MLGLQLGITLLVAACGGLVARRMKIPTGALTGAILAAAALKLMTPFAYFPRNMRILTQFCSGMLIGSRITRKDFRQIHRLAFPIFILLVSMMLMNLTFALSIHYFGGLDMTTALFASAPGGMSDMAIIAQDYGADPVYVSFIQLIRVVFILSCFPTLYQLVSKKQLYPKCLNRFCARGDLTQQQISHPSTQERWTGLFRTVLAGLLGGSLFYSLGIASGALIGALTFCALLNCWHGKLFFPRKMRLAIQIFTGTYIGVQITAKAIAILPSLLVPFVIILLGTVLFAYGIGILLCRLFHFDFLTCMMMGTPGGLNEMSLIADEFHCDVPKIVTLHTARIICVISIFPRLLPLFSHL